MNSAHLFFPDIFPDIFPAIVDVAFPDFFPGIFPDIFPDIFPAFVHSIFPDICHASIISSLHFQSASLQFSSVRFTFTRVHFTFSSLHFTSEGRAADGSRAQKEQYSFEHIRMGPLTVKTLILIDTSSHLAPQWLQNGTKKQRLGRQKIDRIVHPFCKRF